jgi:phospholipid/cholesterol/gamma-HCH transport system substrate-binding protein
MITGPDLLAEATALIAEVRGFATPENREAIADILANVRDATGRIEAITARAEASLARLDDAVIAAEASFSAVDGLIAQDVPALMVDLRAAIASTTGAMEGVRGLSQRDLPQLSTQVSGLILDASRVIAAFDALARQIGSDPGRFLLGTQTPEYRGVR